MRRAGGLTLALVFAAVATATAAAQDPGITATQKHTSKTDVTITIANKGKAPVGDFIFKVSNVIKIDEMTVEGMTVNGKPLRVKCKPFFIDLGSKPTANLECKGSVKPGQTAVLKAHIAPKAPPVQVFAAEGGVMEQISR